MLAVIPTIQHGPQVFSTIEGVPVSLPCRAMGVPTPEITWAKVGFVCAVCLQLLNQSIHLFFNIDSKEDLNQYNQQGEVFAVCFPPYTTQNKQTQSFMFNQGPVRL